MSEPQHEFGCLMERVRAGSERAARQLVDVYGPHILRVVRRRLNRKMRSKFDSTDFVQAVWASFFERKSATELFRGPEDVSAYLACMARNKINDEARRRLRRQKYNVRRERPLEFSPHGSQVFADQPLASGDATGSQVAVAKETWDRLLEGKPPHYRRIVALRALGLSSGEIAERLRVHVLTVRRVLRKLSSESHP